jgi:hypothetical protein
LIIGKKVIGEEIAEIKKDPRNDVSDADLKEQFDFLMKIYRKLDENHKSINQMREIKKAVNEYMKSVKDTVLISKFQKLTKPMLKNLEDLEQSLVQNKAKATQDLLAYPIRLNDKIAGVGSVVSSSDAKPTKGSYEAFEDLSKKMEQTTSKLKKVINEDVPAFNKLVLENQIPAINIEKKKEIN